MHDFKLHDAWAAALTSPDKILAVTAAVAKFGHLRSTEIGQLCWPESRYSCQLAARKAKVLVAQGYLAPRRNALGRTSFVCTRKGAAFLDYHNLNARHTMDLTSVSGATFLHRMLGTQFLTVCHRANLAVASEYEVNISRYPFDASSLYKRINRKPDGFTWKARHQSVTVDWIEIEFAPKHIQEYCALIAHVELVGRSFDRSVVLRSITFVCPSNSHHPRQIVRAAQSFRNSAPRIFELAKHAVRLAILEPKGSEGHSFKTIFLGDLIN
jgi:hypothetical protein